MSSSKGTDGDHAKMYIKNDVLYLETQDEVVEFNMSHYPGCSPLGDLYISHLLKENNKGGRWV